MFDLLAALGIGYLLGAIPSAALLARLRGTSIFQIGSGNMGAMNTARNVGWAVGGAVLLFDVGKGALATYLGKVMVQLGGAGAWPLALPLAAGAGAVLGHAWSVYVGFRGGKALATTFGISLPLYGLAGIYGLVLMLALLLLLRRVTLVSMLTMALYPGLVMLTLRNAGWARDDVFTIVTGVLLVSAIVLLKHVTVLRRDRAAAAAAAQEGDAAPRQGR